MPKKKSQPRLIVAVSDLHAGSTYGLMPPGFHTKEGNEIGLNQIQKWLWQCWGDCWEWSKEIIGNDEWVLVVNGDAIDGNHHGTKEIWSVDEVDHGYAAYHLIRDIGKKASKVFIMEGTESHTKNHEHALAKMLETAGLKIASPVEGKAWKSLSLECAGTLCQFDHHVNTTIRSYLHSSKFAINFGDLRNRKAQAGHKVPKVVVRSHCHEYGAWDDGYGMFVTTPSWQLANRFVRKVVPNALPQVGLVILDWRKTEDNSPPVVHRRLHTIKEPTPVAA